MKVGVLSDSHGNTKNLEEAAKWLIESEKVDLLIHLGDNYRDCQALEKMGTKLIKVPGVFDLEYRAEPEIPHRLIETFDGKKVLISHSEESHKNDFPEDLKPEELISKKEIDLALVGHTHIPKIEDREGILLLNPGHLKLEDKKGYFPSFGLVDFEKKIAKVINLEKKVTIIQKSF